MSQTYTYPLTDFPGTVDFGCLQRQIQVSVAINADPETFMCCNITIDAAALAAVIAFTDPLGAAAVTALDAIVATLATGPFNSDNWTVAELALAPAGFTGETRYATDGRTAAEGPGAGSGVPVYYSGAWCTFYDNTTVLA